MPLRDIDDLAPAPYNPRSIEGPAADGLRASLGRFGDIGGITFNRRTGRLVTGHQRVAQLRKLGATMRTDEMGDAWLEAGGRTYRVRVVDWDEGEEKAANVSANNPHIGGDFTGELDALLGELRRTMEPEAFGGLGLDALFAGQPSVEVGAGDVEQDEVPEPPSEPVTKLGDVWALGGHRLVCGDAFFDIGLVIGERPDLVFMDPPYTVGGRIDAYFYAGCDSPAMKELAETKWDRSFDVAKLADSMHKWLPVDGSVYVCTSHILAGQIWQWLDSSGSSFVSYCVWAKPNPMPSLSKRHWTWATELIAYATFGRHAFNFPSAGHASNVWAMSANAKNDMHPTQKPVAVPGHAIAHSSAPAASVLDPFAGSGTTLIAAEQLGRRAHCIEIEPRYCDVIIERWEQLTGGKAKKVTT